jgi:hypothetical protein
MDPRHIQVVAFGEPTPEEAVHPGPWRYWQALPPSGRVGIFMHAWYNESLRARMHGRIADDRLEAHLQAIREHEQMLSDEGLVLLKFWIHLSKAEQKKRLKAIERDPRLSWRATRDDWKAYHAYRKSYPLWETLLRETSTTTAPWYVVEGTDERYRNLTVGRILLDAMRATAKPVPATRRAKAVRHRSRRSRLRRSTTSKLIRDLDLSKKLSAQAYPAQLENGRGALARLSRHKASPAPAGRRVRRRRCRRQGRRDTPRHRRPRCAPIRDGPDRGADRRGASTPVPVALLAKDSAARRHHVVRSDPGTGAYWSSASNTSARPANGCARMPR